MSIELEDIIMNISSQFSIWFENKIFWISFGFI